MSGKPVLLAVAHGTRSEAGRAQICDLVDTVAHRRPDLDVRLSYVDVQQPRLPEVADLLADRVADAVTSRVVVVPLLLSSGYHVRVDIGTAVDGLVARGVDATATPPLGRHQWIVDILTARIAAADADAVVLAAAGSSDPRSRADVDAVAAALPMPAHVAYASTCEPRVPDVVARLRANGARRIVVAAYLLADGLFYQSLHRAGADLVTAPLVTSPMLSSLVLHRYDSVADQVGHLRAA